MPPRVTTSRTAVRPAIQVGRQKVGTFSSPVSDPLSWSMSGRSVLKSPRRRAEALGSPPHTTLRSARPHFEVAAQRPLWERGSAPSREGRSTPTLRRQLNAHLARVVPPTQPGSLRTDGRMPNRPVGASSNSGRHPGLRTALSVADERMLASTKHEEIPDVPKGVLSRPAGVTLGNGSSASSAVGRS